MDCKTIVTVDFKLGRKRNKGRNKTKKKISTAQLTAFLSFFFFFFFFNYPVCHLTRCHWLIRFCGPHIGTRIKLRGFSDVCSEEHKELPPKTTQGRTWTWDTEVHKHSLCAWRGIIFHNVKIPQFLELNPGLFDQKATKLKSCFLLQMSI